MRLVATLAAGVRGAENGTATFTRRSTANAVVVYRDFEAGSDYGANVVALDAYGAAVAYVSELCDVEIRDTTGTTLKTWTEGDTAGTVEVMSSAFTGTDYETALADAGHPTTLEAVLNLWLTKNGGIDWLLKIGATTDSIAAWVASAGGLVFNVKDPKYGAIGDGVALDYNAIAAAEADADGVGGIVFFPHGTYWIGGNRLTKASGSKSSWVGCGSASTKILGDGTTEILKISNVLADGMYAPVVIEGLSFEFNAACATTVVLVDGSGLALTFRRCCFSSATREHGKGLYFLLNILGFRCQVTECVFNLCGNTDGIVMAGGKEFREPLVVDRCYFDWKSATTTGHGIIFNNALISNCVFDVKGVEDGPPTLISTVGAQLATDQLVVTGCYATENNYGVHGGQIKALEVLDPANVYESGNAWNDCSLDVTGTTDRDLYHGGQLGGRAGRSRETSGDVTALEFNFYESYVLNRTVVGALHIGADAAPLYAGMRENVTVRNATGGGVAIAVTFDGTNVEGAPGGAIATVSDGASVHYSLSARRKHGGGYVWVCESASTGSAWG